MKAKVHRTWPCGMQESLEVKTGFWEQASPRDDDASHPCPLHGLECRRERQPIRAV